MAEMPVADEPMDLPVGLVADLRDAFVVAPAPHVEAAHLGAMADAMAIRSISNRGAGARRGLVAAALVAGIAVVGIAGAGALPGPAQAFVARVVAPLGVDLPDGTSEAPGTPAPSPTPGDSRPGLPSLPSVSPDDPDGALADDPGRGAESPGRSGETPGQSGEIPGQSGEIPGRSAEAPGRTGETPGQSGDAPGHGGANPGNGGGTPPGQLVDPPGRKVGGDPATPKTETPTTTRVKGATSTEAGDGR